LSSVLPSGQALQGERCSSSMKGDSSAKLCASFCNANYARSHCQWCKCSACAFCANKTLKSGTGSSTARSSRTRASSKPAAAVAVTQAARTTAPSHLHGGSGVSNSKTLGNATCDTAGMKADAVSATCSHFCQAERASNHCRYCKCRACPYCEALIQSSHARQPCNSNLTDDFRYRTCASSCSASRAGSQCHFCKCSDCPFCLAAVRATWQPDPPPSLAPHLASTTTPDASSPPDKSAAPLAPMSAASHRRDTGRAVTAWAVFVVTVTSWAALVLIVALYQLHDRWRIGLRAVARDSSTAHQMDGSRPSLFLET